MLPLITPMNPDTGGPDLPVQPRWTLVSVLTLALLAASAAALRFLFLARKDFWFDECFSVEIARMRWHDFARLLWWREANMSLYYLLLRGWLHFGCAPFFLRSLSVLISLATLPAIFWLAARLFDRRVALIAVALISCNAYSIRYAQEARSYSLFLLLTVLSSGFLAGCLREPSRQKRRGYVLSSALALYAHFYALLLVAAHWLSVRTIRKTNSEEKGSQILPVLRREWILIGLAALPMLAFVGKTGAGQIRWIWRPGFRDVLDFFEHLAGNDGLALLSLYAACCVAAILPLRRLLFQRTASWEMWRLRFLLIWLLFPVALALLLSLARPVFLARYFIFCLPALIILAAAGLSSLRSAWMLTVCLAAMLLLSLQGTLSYYAHDFDLERDGSQAATNYIFDHAQPGDAILFHIAGARIPYEFFSSLQGGNSRGGLTPGPEIIFPRHADHLDYRDVTGKPSTDFLRLVPRSYARVWVVLMSNGTRGHPDATTLLVNQIFGGAFAGIQRTEFPGVEVRLYSQP